MKKLPQFELSCSKDEMRLIMNYVKIDKEFTVSTDAHILTVFRSIDVFEEEFIEELPDYPILIHREDWAKLKNCSFLKLNISEKSKILEVSFDKKRDLLIKIELEKDISNYPNWKAVIPTEKTRERQPLSEIGINADKLATVQKILDNSVGMRLEFFASNIAILCKSINVQVKGYCIVMPIALMNGSTEKIDTFV